MGKERILIANRGEIALRIIYACRDLGIDYVVVYTKQDRESMHVRKAMSDESGSAYCISSYKDPNEIFAVADYSDATAIHPGYGFFSENFRFARRAALRSRPLIFIGPSWKVIRDLGSKINTKRVAKELDIPVIPGSDSPIYNEIEAESIAKSLFMSQKEQGLSPSILVKASAGGGGMGIEEVKSLDAFKRVYRRIQNYAKRMFGDEGVLIEQCLTGYNHLEVQLLCSQHGEVLHFGSRNCTIQSTGRQKRVEAAPGYDPSMFTYPFDAGEVLENIVNYSVKLAEHVNYDNVGTWEWIVTGDGKPYLLEVNTRIQVENEISARVAHINGHNKPPNLIREQIRAAMGENLGFTQNDIVFKGTSIELRIVAEDVKRGFSPWCGKIIDLRFPEEPWLRLYTHVPSDRDYEIPTEYDPNLALAIIWGRDTKEAIERAVSMIERTEIDGRDSAGGKIITNLDYLKKRVKDILRFNRAM